ncbi:MAG: T9SS type A sorting domain-containing protein, partial [Bacteroidota bacterium]
VRDYSAQTNNIYEWYIPESVSVIADDDGSGTVKGSDGKEYPNAPYIQFIVPEPDTIEITQTSILEGCFYEMTKKIWVDYSSDEYDPYMLNPKLAEMNVYPNLINPGDPIDVYIKSPDEEPVTIELIDLDGSIIDEKLVYGHTSYKVTLQTEDTQSTMYFVKVTMNSTAITRKVMIL